MREWFKKWQKVIVWIIAVSFVAGIAWWSVASYLSGRQESSKISLDQAIGYLTIAGSPIEDSDTWVLPSELDSEYGNLLSNYGISQLDPIFQEPSQKASLLEDLLKNKVILHYAKQNKLTASNKEIEAKLNEYRQQIEKDQSLVQYIKQRYGSVNVYLNAVLKPTLEKSLTQQKVVASVANVDSEEMKKYFEENIDQLRKKYDKVDAKLVSFTDESSANKFINILLEKGFDGAASEMGLSVQDIPNLTRGIFDEKFEKDIFSGATNTTVGPIPLGSSWYVLEVQSATVLTDFENFALSDTYESEKNSLQSQKMQQWYENYTSEKNIELVIADEVYSTWRKVSSVSTPTEYESLREELKEKIFQDNSISPQAPDTLKSAYVVLLEKIEESLDQSDDQSSEKLKQIMAEKEMLIKDLYEQYPTSLEVASRMYQLDQNNLQVKYNYLSLLYSEIKPYLYPEYIQYLLQSLIEIESGFSSIALDTNASTEMRASSYYNLYDLSKSLEDATSAKFYLEQLRRIDPNYIDFDAALSELE
ncbi:MULTISPECIES: peptidyl-prolyl cis-trans isomerase [Pseudothermotoga]|jgi:hypothetical protein|uniref:peptidyl-prolyl cis-trans isomerase n=1 Tax=Pseudothermotoga TaxID=1643951 RepID=UPI0004260F85|nr:MULTISPECIES: peptidyl-prolyl cis-trans isomerase [Pseudothermotoga]KUK20898.1 MAG: Uncharacterized protein XD56_1174 [Pseudothermotoga lettingae]MDK2884090.1 hypothetical protein [Pseudothermotoga sp.]HBJ82113.1 hypothetical protein [Pseudothermotoga sp.]HBT26871.1 hypothetical protein [Pseudothermotoga sp.]